MTDMSSVQAWSMLLGIITPFVVSVVKNPKWTAGRKRVVSVVIAAAIGTMNVLVSGAISNWADYTLQGVLVNLALVVGSGQAAYALLWKPTGVTDKVEVATSPNNVLSE